MKQKGFWRKCLSKASTRCQQQLLFITAEQRCLELPSAPSPGMFLRKKNMSHLETTSSSAFLSLHRPAPYDKPVSPV